jgi:hypothetical protein
MLTVDCAIGIPMALGIDRAGRNDAASGIYFVIRSGVFQRANLVLEGGCG